MMTETVPNPIVPWLFAGVCGKPLFNLRRTVRKSLTNEADLSTVARRFEGTMMTERSETLAQDRALSRHILPTSGTMIGICTTLIGLVKIVEGRIGPSRVDEYAALASLFFMASAATSYLSIRYVNHPRLSKRLEATADQCFLVGLLSIVVIGLFFAYEVI
jgi:hypothetical protein